MQFSISSCFMNKTLSDAAGQTGKVIQDAKPSASTMVEMILSADPTSIAITGFFRLMLEQHGRDVATPSVTTTGDNELQDNGAKATSIPIRDCLMKVKNRKAKVKPSHS